MKFAFKFCAWLCIFMVSWLNLQPWVDVGYFLTASGMEFFFGEALFNIPVLGNVFDFMVRHAAWLFAIALWLVVQTLQVCSLMEESPSVLAFFERMFVGLPMSGWVRDNSKMLSTLGWSAYGVEAFVCFLAYPPYGEGLSDLAADWMVWDPYLVDWPNIALMAVTILMFEFAVWLLALFGTLLWQTRDTKPRQPKPQQQQQQPKPQQQQQQPKPQQ